MSSSEPRVICLIPSLTETLLEVQAPVIARTRYCIHPAAQVKSLPVVGGTKDLNIELLTKLKPDLLILDKEENLPWMKEKAPCEVFVTHVDSLTAMSETSRSLEKYFPKMSSMTTRWKKVIEAPSAKWSWSAVPGANLQWGPEPDEIIYMIWKNPWMCVGPGTFITSVLEKLGAGPKLVPWSEKYPKISQADFQKPGRGVLFSSEPFPFAKNPEELKSLVSSGALVDGESLSWFGSRALSFLEQQLRLEP